ncbi:MULTISPECIES: nuclear transport factor 2 family protein [Leuconostoc]|uniref:nuclear transport factor 2 family protein n=1 Tax=Leuconostoc TaxID=1243 RepID=UPI001B8B2F58|nr:MULTISPECIES: nuclear transport factor 2 family protein [Leuconostoc]MBS0941845.1 nuclear transport factor 2 family protein [Leuconostoc mesenteroides]MBS1008190.1 nuclear transport factor 2 family protein [Leuconostoc suionicum]
MEKQEMKKLIEDAYSEVLNNLKVDKIEKYFGTQYLQTTDGVNSTFNQFKKHIVALQKVTIKIQVTNFQEEMFDVENQKIFLHYVVDVTKADGKEGHVEVFAVFTVNDNKIVRCEELTRALDDKSLNDLGSKQ